MLHSLDALLAIHELPSPDLHQILNLHPEAHFQVDEANQTNRWWPPMVVEIEIESKHLEPTRALT